MEWAQVSIVKYIYIRRTYRRQGYGRKLMRATVAYARKNGERTVLVWRDSINNKRFFQQLSREFARKHKQPLRYTGEYL